MIRAMVITFSGVTLLFGAAIVLRTKATPVIEHPHDPTIVVTLAPIKPPAAPPKQVEPPSPPASVRTTRLVPFVVAPENSPRVENPPVTIDIQGPVGPVATPGKDDGSANVTPTQPGSGTGTQPASDEIHPPVGLDEMPMPVGGESAWAKFLNRNLRFPAAAQEEGVSGRVIMSFVIEKDGSLSNITVERPAGYGFDEEAVRVLKLAKAWKPGKQNGQPVRVKYNIPINFQVADQN
jgi:protein TonB